MVGNRNAENSVFVFILIIRTKQMMVIAIDILRPHRCTWQAKLAERPLKVTNEGKDETPFRYAYAEIRTQLVVIGFPTPLSVKPWRSPPKLNNIYPKMMVLFNMFFFYYVKYINECLQYTNVLNINIFHNLMLLFNMFWHYVKYIYECLQYKIQLLTFSVLMWIKLNYRQLTFEEYIKSNSLFF